MQSLKVESFPCFIGSLTVGLCMVTVNEIAHVEFASQTGGVDHAESQVEAARTASGNLAAEALFSTHQTILL